MDIQKLDKNWILFSLFFFLIILFLITFNSNFLGKNILQNGTVSLTFDDGYKVHYDIAYPELKKNNITATFYILANHKDLFESKELMNLEQAKEIQDNGFEIGSHTLNHSDLLTIDSQELNKQLAESKQILENAGINVSSFSYPFGRLNNAIVKEVKKYYSSARTTIPGYNNLGNLDVYKLKSIVITGKMSTKEICNLIKENKNWLILTFHNINLENSSSNVEWDISLKNFKAILECIKTEKIKVKTIKEVVNEKRN